jgi:hypothetical protein
VHVLSTKKQVPEENAWAAIIGQLIAMPTRENAFLYNWAVAAVRKRRPHRLRNAEIRTSAMPAGSIRQCC